MLRPVTVARRVVAMPEPFDIPLTFGATASGRRDPTTRVGTTDWWRATNTPAGPATIHVHVDRHAAEAGLEAWGDGRVWAIAHAPALLGFGDDGAPFEPADGLVRSLLHTCRGMRLAQLQHAHDFAVRTIIEQRVTTIEARRSWHGLVRRFGTPAPGPVELTVPPSCDVIARIPDWEWRKLGVEGRRSAAIRAFARDGKRVERSTREGIAMLDRRLRSMRGIGIWTSATVTHYVLGDADAVPVGDWHLPSHVGFALAGERDADDARMLELLEPFRPHRARVWRMIVAATPAPERRAPRAEILGLLRIEGRRRRFAAAR
jgi:3-methyladenine DNA glycosylase/8-oxoguanine DNA glycosylase